VKLGILSADTVRPQLAADYGQYPEMFRTLLSAEDPSVTYADYDVEREEYPADIDEVDAYLLTGSKLSVYDDIPWIHSLTEFVRSLDARKKKLVGICFGHQMVAHALGGEVIRSPRGWGVGVQSYAMFETPRWHDGGDLTFSLLASHQDQVVTPSPGARVLAGSAFCEAAVCQVGEHILSFQGHPEFTPGYAGGLMTVRKDAIGEPVYSQGMNSLTEPAQGDRIARWILNFLQQ